jgi:hypothetical protein
MGAGVVVIASALGVTILTSFLFLAVRVGKSMMQDAGHNSGAICALVLIGLIVYVIVAGLLSSILGARVFDWFAIENRYYDEV